MTWLIWIAVAALLLTGLAYAFYRLICRRVYEASRQGWLIAMRAMSDSAAAAYDETDDEIRERLKRKLTGVEPVPDWVDNEWLPLGSRGEDE